MNKKKYTRDKAFKSKKKIWLIHIKLREAFKSDSEIYNSENWVSVYVVDDSMARAIQKAVYHFSRETGIKFIRMKKYYERDYLDITCRRATKIEIVNVRAGLGLKDFRGKESGRVI